MMPGSFNGLVARSVSDHGFEATYISGAALTAGSGIPDIGLLTLDKFCNVISDVYMASKLPIIADADTGFGEGEMCAKTVWSYN
jgi:methylisocitrate lyase